MAVIPEIIMWERQKKTDNTRLWQEKQAYIQATVGEQEGENQIEKILAFRKK